MSFKEECKSMGIKTTPQQRRAALFLENCGYIFCADFGWGNAEEVARRDFGFRVADPDIKTLNGKVIRLLRDHQYWTPWDLCDNILAKYAILVSDASVTSRIRDLRKPRFGAHIIDKRRIVDSNAYEYRLRK
jgi:hypothetical protein